LQLVSTAEETAMTNLVMAMFMSLDGYIEGPDGFASPPWSDEVSQAWVAANLQRAGHLLYGRANYDFQKSFWPTDQAAGAPEAATMNGLRKTVISHTARGDAGWNGAYADAPLAETVARLKRETASGEVYCFGGAGLAQSLLAQDLVDEFYLMVTPVLLGGGKRLFEAGAAPGGLTLLECRPLDVGSVILRYRRDRAA
jgi:dihydrofolate reductase